MGEYLLAGLALLCHLVCAELAHADHVTQSFAGEDELIARQLKCEALRGKVERLAKLVCGDLSAANADLLDKPVFARLRDLQI